MIWAIVALLGAACPGVVALRQGEQISALWIVVAAVSIDLVAYRYYRLYIAKNVMGLDPTLATPAHLNNHGLDDVPTNKHVLFGHHFAAIAGTGPLAIFMGVYMRYIRPGKIGAIALVRVDHFATCRKVWQRLVETARLCSRVPDHDNYIRHLQEKHPEREPMDYPRFFRERQNARFGGRSGGFRCC